MARIAFLMDDQFEDTEFRVPYDRARSAGHEPVILGTTKERAFVGIRGTEKVFPDRTIEDADPSEFDALVIPGGYSPDRLRMNEKMVAFTKAMGEAKKPIAAICHAPWMLLEADLVRNRTVTSWPSLKTDLKNAGANWIDKEVVEDGNLITSRKPMDASAFTDALLRRLQATAGQAKAA